jgi:hypothetical protein
MSVEKAAPSTDRSQHQGPAHSRGESGHCSSRTTPGCFRINRKDAVDLSAACAVLRVGPGNRRQPDLFRRRRSALQSAQCRERDRGLGDHPEWTRVRSPDDLQRGGPPVSPSVGRVTRDRILEGLTPELNTSSTEYLFVFGAGHSITCAKGFEGFEGSRVREVRVTVKRTGTRGRIIQPPQHVVLGKAWRVKRF